MKYMTYSVLLLSVFAGAFISTAHAVQGDILSVTISEDGWYAEVVVEGFVDEGSYNYGPGLNDDGDPATIDNNPEGATMVFTVSSEGFNTSGTLGTINRTIYGTKFVRKPYPYNSQADGSVADEVEVGGNVTLKVALSDFIYNDDSNITVDIANGFYTDDGAGGSTNGNTATSNLAVTNNSTLDYPKVIGRWAWPGYERLTEDFLVEVVAFQRFAQNGKPVAAVVFEANDQSGNSVYATTTDVTITTRPGDANTVLVYAATLDIDSLTQGDVIDVNFTAYPWVGDENATLNSRTTADGYAQPDERLGPLHNLNDKNGTYGVGYAYVDPIGGNDATGVVYSSATEAEAGNAYRTIGNAASGLRSYNNTNFGRNNAGGGVVLLAEGDHAYPSVRPSPDLGTEMDTWMIITRAPSASKANTKISSGGDRINGLLVKFEGLTLSPSVPSGGGIIGRTATDSMWLHDNIINATNTVPFFAWRTAYATNNHVVEFNKGLRADYGGTRGPFGLVRGNTADKPITSHFYSVIGNKNITGGLFIEAGSNPANHALSSNALFAYNSVYEIPSDLVYAKTADVSGIAFVQNLFERTGSHPSGIVALSVGDGNGGNAYNFLMWHNTFAGERQQHGYNSNGTVSVDKLNWSERFNIYTEQGKKTDTFDDVSMNPAPNGNRTGNWPLVYSVGSIGNKSLKSSFAGDFNGLFSQWGPKDSYDSPGFIDDRSKKTGSNLGNGNYALTGVSSAIDVAAVGTSLYEVLPYDLVGNYRYGSSDTGAYEYQPQYTMGVNDISGSTTVRVYGDEKWRPVGTASISNAVDMSVSLPGSNRGQWLDINISAWDTEIGAELRSWTEETIVSGITNTQHTLGDFVPNTSYVITVDGSSSNITGFNCADGVCLSDASGYITFSYVGDYSTTRTFVIVASEVVFEDTVAPTISNISSDTSDGTYGIGSVIDIDITFSEAVVATSSVTVTLETGNVDQTCTFTVATSTTASCNYTVQFGDDTTDLTVLSVSGYIEDAAGNVMTNFVPAVNLADNKDIVIDTNGVQCSTGGIPTPLIMSEVGVIDVYQTYNAEAGETIYVRFCGAGGQCSGIHSIVVPEFTTSL